jgi:hypothetical protein
MCLTAGGTGSSAKGFCDVVQDLLLSPDDLSGSCSKRSGNPCYQHSVHCFHCPCILDCYSLMAWSSVIKINISGLASVTEFPECSLICIILLSCINMTRRMFCMLLYTY